MLFFCELIVPCCLTSVFFERQFKLVILAIAPLMSDARGVESFVK